MRIKNIIISIIMLGLVGYGGLKFYMYYKAKQDIDALFAPARMVMNVEYDQISSSVFGPVGIKGLRFGFPQLGEEITVSEFTLLNRDNIGKMMNGTLPSRLHFRITDLHFSLALLDKLEKETKLAAQRRGQAIHPKKESTPDIIKRLGYQELFDNSNDWRALGYEKLNIDIDFDLQFNPGTREARLIVREVVDDMGELLIDISLADMSSDIGSAVLGLRIKEMKLDFTDDTYLDRLLKLYADKENMAVDAYRRKAAAQVEQDIAAKKIKLSASSVKNIKRFIENPKRIIVTSYPNRPVGLESLKHYKPGDVPMLLNLQARLE